MRKTRLYFYVLLFPVSLILFSYTSPFKTGSYTRIKLCPTISTSPADIKVTRDILNKRLKLFGEGKVRYRLSVISDTFVVDIDNKYLSGNVNIKTIHDLLLSKGELRIYPIYGSIEAYPLFLKVRKLDSLQKIIQFVSDGNMGYKSQPDSVSFLRGLAVGKDTARVNNILGQDSIMRVLPRGSKLLWSDRPMDFENGSRYKLYFINTTDNDCNKLTGNIFKRVYEDKDTQGYAEVRMFMNSVATGTWAKITARNVNKFIAFVIDDKVYSDPIIMGEIKGGGSGIAGRITDNEIHYLIAILSGGALPVKLVMVSEKNI